MTSRYIDLLKKSLLGEVPIPHLPPYEHFHQDAVTMIGRARLENLESAMSAVLLENIPGHFIETGVWRGGACIFMRAMLAVCAVHTRSVFVADSFCGLPPPDAAYPADANSKHHIDECLMVSQDAVRANFEAYGLLDDQVQFVPGWFKDTLPALDHGFALIRLDGDMYGSTMDALTALYPKLSRGGYCIIDDYGLNACKAAVIDYRYANGINVPIERIDWTGVYWRKA